MIEPEQITEFPGNDVICARGISADAEAAYELVLTLVESHTSPEDVDPPDLVSHQWIVMPAILAGVPPVGGIGIDGIAELEPEQTATRLYGCIEIGGGKRGREPDHPGWSAEGVGSVGFLSCNEPASRPLGATIVARKCYRANQSVPIDDCGPHLIAKTGIAPCIDTPNSATTPSNSSLDCISIRTIPGSQLPLSPVVMFLDLLVTQTEKPGGIVVKDVAFLLLAQEGRFLNHGKGTFNHSRPHHLV
jgi:hypothetical protein